MKSACLLTILINMTTFPWNEHDKKVEKRAVHVCATDVRYQDQPCLKKFVKRDVRSYWAICGKGK